MYRNPIHTIILAASFSLTFVSPAEAVDEDTIIKCKGLATQQGLTTQRSVLNDCIEWAEEGGVKAQAVLANIYNNQKKYKEAAQWYLKAAQQSDAYSLQKLGQYYEYGRGVDKSEERAISLYKMAIDRNMRGARTSLGRLYKRRGEHDEANRLFEIDADQGYLGAESELGNSYYEGKGFKKDNNKALLWYKKAAKKGLPSAQRMVDLIAEENRAAQKKQMEAEAELQRLALVAEQKQLAIVAAKKLEAEESAKRAAAAKAATKRTEKNCYSSEGDQKKRFNNCLTLARNGDTKAQVNVMNAYTFRTIGSSNESAVDPNYKKAKYWAEKLIASGITEAEPVLAEINKAIAIEDERAAIEKREKLANTWFKLLASDYFRKRGVATTPEIKECKKSDNPAAYAKSVGMLATSVEMVDEIQQGDKVNEVTVVMRTNMNGMRNQPMPMRFFRGLHRCEAYVSKEIQILKAAKAAQEKELDKYR